MSSRRTPPRCSSAGRDERTVVLEPHCLEERLVDLAVIDRYVLLETQPDDLLAVDSVLLRELLGRQVIRHPFLPAEGGPAENTKGPPCASTMSLWASAIRGHAAPRTSAMLLVRIHTAKRSRR